MCVCYLSLWPCCSLGDRGLGETHPVLAYLYQRRVGAYSCLHSSPAVSPSHLVPGLGASSCLAGTAQPSVLTGPLGDLLLTLENKGEA